MSDSEEKNFYVKLPNSLISISGEDSKSFLQGLLTQDINKASSQNSIYSYILTPQGKFLFDFFVLFDEENSRYLLDVKSDFKDDMMKKMKLYKLRSKVDIKDISDEYGVYALFGNNVAGFYDKEKLDEVSIGLTLKRNNSYMFADPRCLDFSLRLFCYQSDKQELLDSCLDEGDVSGYELRRIQRNIPEGGQDLEQDNAYPLQFRMKELNGVDFNKGCYVGQEVTARTEHRGNQRKTTFLLELTEGGEVKSNYGDELTDSDGKKIGKLLSSQNNYSLALLEKQRCNFGDVVYSDAKLFKIIKVD